MHFDDIRDKIINDSMAKSTTTYQVLRERIVTGEYGPGYRIVVDAVAAELGLSTGPVREALRRLEGVGLVQHKPNVGVTVVAGRDEIFLETSEVMASLEGLATALAAPHLTAANFEHLRALNAEMRDAAVRGEMLSFAELNREFHTAIYERCPNNYLRTMIATSWDRLEVGYSVVFSRIPLRHERSLAEHEQLLALLEAGAPEREVESFAREHKLGTKRAFMASLEDRETVDSGADSHAV